MAGAVARICRKFSAPACRRPPSPPSQELLVIFGRPPRAPRDDKREERGGGWSPMRGCSAIKANGERCRGIAATGSDYCPAHDPARADARIKAASKAAKSRSAVVTETDITIIKE